MLGEILATLKTHQGNKIDSENVGINVGITEAERRLLAFIAGNPRTTAAQAADFHIAPCDPTTPRSKLL